jgi:hypothetical protein
LSEPVLFFNQQTKPYRLEESTPQYQSIEISTFDLIQTPCLGFQTHLNDRDNFILTGLSLISNRDIPKTFNIQGKITFFVLGLGGKE